MHYVPIFVHQLYYTVIPEYTFVKTIYTWWMLSALQIIKRSTYSDPGSLISILVHYQPSYNISHTQWNPVDHCCLPIPVMPLEGGQGGLYPTRNLGVQLTLLQLGGKIIPTALLLAHPDFKTKRHLWILISIVKWSLTDTTQDHKCIKY